MRMDNYFSEAVRQLQKREEEEYKKAQENSKYKPKQFYIRPARPGMFGAICIKNNQIYGVIIKDRAPFLIAPFLMRSHFLTSLSQFHYEPWIIGEFEEVFTKEEIGKNNAVQFKAEDA